MAPWAFKKEPQRNLQEFLTLLGCKDKDPKGIVAFLRSTPCHQLVEAQEKLITAQVYVKIQQNNRDCSLLKFFPFQRSLQCDFPFGPGPEHRSSQPFMPTNLIEAIEEGIQVPLIIGWNSLEGFYALKGTN